VLRVGIPAWLVFQPRTATAGLWLPWSGPGTSVLKRHSHEGLLAAAERSFGDGLIDRAPRAWSGDGSAGRDRLWRGALWLAAEPLCCHQPPTSALPPVLSHRQHLAWTGVAEPFMPWEIQPSSVGNLARRKPGAGSSDLAPYRFPDPGSARCSALVAAKATWWWPTTAAAWWKNLRTLAAPSKLKPGPGARKRPAMASTLLRWKAECAMAPVVARDAHHRPGMATKLVAARLFAGQWRLGEIKLPDAWNRAGGRNWQADR